MIHAALLLAFASVGYPPAASPALAADTTSLVVRYDDLDLGSMAGQTALTKRIGLAIRHVCDEPGLPLGERARRSSACMDAARQRAEHDLAQAIASAKSPQAATAGRALQNGY
jgi:UrcA family protein